MTANSTAVLLLAYGGPDSLDDIPAYLLDIRGGRETPQCLIDEITDRYRQIGSNRHCWISPAAPRRSCKRG
jgi:ferrochelatase